MALKQLNLGRIVFGLDDKNNRLVRIEKIEEMKFDNYLAVLPLDFYTRLEKFITKRSVLTSLCFFFMLYGTSMVVTSLVIAFLSDKGMVLPTFAFFGFALMMAVSWGWYLSYGVHSKYFQDEVDAKIAMALVGKRWW